jgi:hypothetical protein
MQLDGKDVNATRSVSGNGKYSSTFGMYVDFLSQGIHKITVFYRTNAQGLSFPAGGEDYMQRSLNIIALPEAAYERIIPGWTSRISSVNIWQKWNGLALDLVVPVPVTYLIYYTAAVLGKNSILASDLSVNKSVRKACRSVAGATSYAQNTGFLVEMLVRGKHHVEARYRHGGMSNTFRPYGGEFQTKALYALALPGASHYSEFTESAYVLEAGNRWTDWPGLTKDIKLANSRYVIVMYSVALDTEAETTGVKEMSSCASRLHLNDVELPRTRSICGDSKFCQNTGFWVGILHPGEHVFKVMYRTPVPGPHQRKAHDWRNRVLNIIVLAGGESRAASLAIPRGPGIGSPEEKGTETSSQQDSLADGSLLQLTGGEAIIEEAKALGARLPPPQGEEKKATEDGAAAAVEAHTNAPQGLHAKEM